MTLLAQMCQSVGDILAWLPLAVRVLRHDAALLQFVEYEPAVVRQPILIVLVLAQQREACALQSASLGLGPG